MRTTIDGAGRIVIPKAIRQAMHLDAGRAVDVVFTDGKIEIEVAPLDVAVVVKDGIPVMTTGEDIPPLTDEIVRATLDSVRR